MSPDGSTAVVGHDGVARCAWAAGSEEYRRYHDEEWGFPLHGDQKLFEKLSLEGFQAGLSWITILRRRPAFREVFHGFDIAAVAAMTPEEGEALMQDARIIRNRAKIEATISNARITLELDGGLDGLDLLAEPGQGAAPQPTQNLRVAPLAAALCGAELTLQHPASSHQPGERLLGHGDAERSGRWTTGVRTPSSTSRPQLSTEFSPSCAHRLSVTPPVRRVARVSVAGRPDVTAGPGA